MTHSKFKILKVLKYAFIQFFLEDAHQVACTGDKIYRNIYNIHKKISLAISAGLGYTIVV